MITISGKISSKILTGEETMSISILYHSQGISDYSYYRTIYEGGEIIYKIRPQPRLIRCPICGSKDVSPRGSVMRRIMLLPTGTHKNFAEVDIPRVWCPSCAKLRQIKPVFVDEQRSYSRAFERYVIALCEIMTVQDVAVHLGISWGTVKDIHKRRLLKKYGTPSLKKLRSIAIDEISIGAGHRYLTVVLNLENGAVVFAGDGKGSDALLHFWKQLGRRKGHIKSVAVDMSPAYTKAVRENLPKATLVYDHFHVIKLYNEKLTSLRRSQYYATHDADKKAMLKRTRWILLKNPANLDVSKDEPERLKRALEVNEPLMKAYYLKEELHRLWEQENKLAAMILLASWLSMAQASGVGMLKRFAKTLMGHREGILSYYDHKITSARIEGTNAKIRVMQRKGYGFRDEEYLKLKILALHESKRAYAA
jgi:transposase